MTIEAESSGTPPPVGTPPPTAPAAPPAKPKKKRKWLRRIAVTVFVGGPLSALALWIAIHKIEWLGPWLADAGRSVIGNDAIAKLEDWAYGVQDEYNQATKGDTVPTAHWEVPDLPESVKDGTKKHAYPRFVPTKLGPMYTTFSAPGDGDWVPVIDPRNPDEPPPMWKTLLHPDKQRGWGLAAVVAVDLRQVRLSLVAGMHEPTTKLKDGKEHTRTGVIVPADVPRALAAFNGGFKTTHGNYGMKAEGVLFVEPRGFACTIAGYDKDALRIGAWETLETSKDEMVWFRQAPACMYENNEMHKGLTVEQTTLWGATLDKDTVIRRSAIGLSADRQTLFVTISEATTATAIAKATHHAGATDVAQLDVNWSYPKFVTIEPTDGDAAMPKVKAIIDGFEYTEDDYVRKPMGRDFFYLTRKPPEAAK